ncbi:MAG: hypothetical protein K9J51_09660 [Desulfotignum sp.]|nr:hypothetical protein [Desulfotignum sp.]
MNKQPLTTEQSAALENVCHLFADWRKGKTGRERIPEQLWQAAADLYHTRKMTVNRIVHALRLSHSALKAKIYEMPPAATDPPEEDASSLFIEVAAPQGYSDCVIEMENQTGIKMRMCLRGRPDPAVLDLGRYFLAGVP